MNQKALYEHFLEFSKKSDTLPDTYKRFKKIVIDICYILGFKQPNQDQMAIFEKNLLKWEKDFETYKAINHIFKK